MDVLADLPEDAPAERFQKGSPMKGSCLCGTVVYEVDRFDMPIAHCHCRTCQKAHAAPMATNAGVLREHFRWIQGQERLSAFESSPGKRRYFCSICGSHLVAERPALPHLIVRVATLDEDPGTRPQAHIWTSHDLPWLDVEAGVHYLEWPPGR
ncbi:MAG: aldehyde-activating protein [Alphaproteobacteria bacterium CG_4_10_14_0_2_um_filter_63_37]|nr:MAG: aldehyde-activating protein [Alphaproteobacteria bacterium CG_4_10_14_0_2_um_filter_63_37]